MLRIAPLFPVAVGLIAGILVDRTWTPPVGVHVAVLAGGFLAAFAARTRHRLGPYCVLMAAFAAGGLLHWSTARRIPGDSIERYADAEGLLRIHGRVLFEPQQLAPQPHPFGRWISRAERTGFSLDCEAVQGVSGPVPVSGTVRVTVYETVLDLRPGDRCEVFGRLMPLRPPANPGGFDWEQYSRRQGVAARLVCQHRESVRLLTPQTTRAKPSALAWLRQTAAALLTDDLGAEASEEASLLETMLLGQRSRLSQRLNELFVSAGCIHFLAVSGVHLVIVMYLANLAFRMLGAGHVGSTWGMIVAVVAYALLAEPRPPILRAAIIGLMYCAARLMGRERAHLNWVSAAAILLLVVDPRLLFDVGFQLSFAAVLGVSYLAPALRSGVRRLVHRIDSAVFRRGLSADDRRILAILRARSDQRPVPRRVVDWFSRRTADGLAIGCAAWLAGAPIIAATFYRVQPWGALNSFLLMPLVTIVMALGFAKAALALISPTAAAMTGSMLSAVDGFMLRMVENMAALPSASAWVAPPPWWVAALFYACLVGLAIRFSPGAEPLGDRPEPGIARRPLIHLPRFAVRTAVSGLVLIAALGSDFFRTSRPMTLTVLAVGRGSATVVELPDGETMLYDVGSSYASEVGRYTVVPFLRSRGIRSIDRLYISHANLDHFSGVPSVMEEIETGPVSVNDAFFRFAAPRSPVRHLLSLLQEAERPIEVLEPAPAAWTFGGARFELLWPGETASGLPANDTSTTLRITYAGRSVLLTGDIDEAAQEALLAEGDLSAGVLLLPHHGSVRRTTSAFVRAVGADALIRSSGERMDETLSGLANIAGDTPLFNTADHGAITIELDADGVRIETMFPGDNR